MIEKAIPSADDFQNVLDGLDGEVWLWLGLPDKSMGMAERDMRRDLI